MCGISGYFAREAKPSAIIFKQLLDEAANRGTDGVGYVCISRNKKSKQYMVSDSEKFTTTGSLIHSTIARDVANYFDLGDIFLSNNRAAPETEVQSIDCSTIQPIITDDIALVHNGAVSKKIYDELGESYKYKYTTKIDSEAIIAAYIKNGRNIKSTMQYLSGGYAILMVDFTKGKLYAICSHNPLYTGYVKGHGLFFHSSESAIFETISALKGIRITKCNICCWEDYYSQRIPSNTICEFDLDSGMRNDISFTPRYIHPNYDPYLDNIAFKANPKVKYLVAASGGLDSGTTLAILKASGLDVHAVYFKYGHRGEDAETIAINNICTVLNIELTVFDISKDMKILDSSGMLTNKDAAITTGTNEGLKTTVAWTCFRNGFFVTYMGALAEKQIINDKYDQVYITGGYMNLSESGVYCDNSERFIDSFIGFAKFASIVGTKIKASYCCSQLLKTEQYIILERLGLLKKLGQYMISCDRPIVKNGIAYNCCDKKNGIPSCGSGKLSYWAARRAGVKDPRKYYFVHDPDYKHYHVDDENLKVVEVDNDTILKKLFLPPINLRILQKKLDQKRGFLGKLINR